MSGILTVKPQKAELTHDVDWLSKMDPYVTLILGGQKVKSSVCKEGGKKPHWKESWRRPS